MKKAIVTGITGQDGAYLAKLLLTKNYQVFGAYRRSSTPNFWRIKELAITDHPHFHLVEFDLTDNLGSVQLLESVMPDEVYNLAAQSFVATSFKQPMMTAKINGCGVLNLLEAIRLVNPKIRFYQASTSEMFGKVQAVPQSEQTPFYPRSPYGISKLFAHWMTINYREAYNMFACSGILFNHESPLRGLEFVTRKITDGIAKIKLGMIPFLELGNLNAKRDWGYAGDYVEGMYQMLQYKEPGDYVLATGRSETVKYFVEMAGKAVDINIDWQGRNEKEIGIDTASGKVIIKINPQFYRPAEVDYLVGDYSKAKRDLNWQPKLALEGICTKMAQADFNRNNNSNSAK
ncbi:MAG: GDP-mannose 4,6-dehydratase [Proteobacteria bacterium]|nr:GDP-mannose 4,6-dehydratase [Pseudomonadota bacterium]